MKHTRSETSFMESIMSQMLPRWSGLKLVYRDAQTNCKKIGCKSAISGGRAWNL